MIEIKKKKKETDLPLFKHGVYKLSIHSLYIHVPSTEKINLLSTNYKLGQRKHQFRKLKFGKVKLFLRVNISG